MTIIVESDIIFAHAPRPNGEPEALRLDLYLPEDRSAALRPAILWLHGGGFKTGNDKRQKYIVRLATEFAGRGYVGIAPDYRVRADPATGLAGCGPRCDGRCAAGARLGARQRRGISHGPEAHRPGGRSAGGMIVHNLCYRITSSTEICTSGNARGLTVSPGSALRSSL